MITTQEMSFMYVTITLKYLDKESLQHEHVH